MVDGKRQKSHDLANLLILDHLSLHEYHLTRSVFIPEARLPNDADKSQISTHLFFKEPNANLLVDRREDGSAIMALVDQCVARRDAREISTQTDKDPLEVRKIEA